MKKRLLLKSFLTLSILPLLAVGLSGQNARAALPLPFYDGFPNTYAEGGNLGAAGVGSATWTLGTPAADIVVGSAYAMSYPGLKSPAAGSLGVHVTFSGTIHDEGINFASVNSGSVYASFVFQLKHVTASGSTRLIAELHNSSSTPSQATPALGIGLNSSGQLTVGKATLSTTATTPALTVGVTNFVVVRYNFTGVAGNDTVDLWLNPDASTFNTGTPPTATLAGQGVGNNNVSSLQSFFFGIGTSSATGEYYIDEVRVGASWAVVTPVDNNYFQSRASGDWSNTNTWNISSDGVNFSPSAGQIPTISDTVTVTNAAVTATNATASAAILDVFGTLSVPAGLTTPQLTVESGGTLDITNTTDTVGSVTMAGGSINGTGGTLTGSSYTMTGGAVGGNNMSVAANLAGTGVLTMSGTNATLTMSGTNTYSGATTIANGTVQANGSLALSGSSILKSGGSTANTSTLKLGTADSGYRMNQLSIGGIMNFSGPVSGSATLTFTNGAVITGTTGKKLNLLDANTSVVINGPLFDLISTQGTAGRVLAITNDGTLTINAPIRDLAPNTNSGGLSLAGEGIMILNGTNTYSGTNDINTGTLRVNGASALSAVTTLATGPSTLNSTTLELGTPDSYSARSVFLTGILNVRALGGTATLTLTDASVMGGSGSRAIDAGSNVTVQFNGPFDLFGNTATLNRNLNVQGAGNFVFNSPLTNTDLSGTYICGLRKTGTGTATLNTVNYYNGDTAINEGTVAIGAGGSINLSSNINVAADATFDVSAGGFTLAAYQILANNQSNTNSTAPGIIKGNLNAGSGGLTLTLTNGTLCFTVTNGTLTLSGSTVVTINNAGPSLAAGSYKLISKSTGGAVAGTVTSSVSVGGNGAAAAASLQNSGGELYLNVGSVTSPTLGYTQAGNVLTFNWTGAFKLQSQTNSLSVGLQTAPASWIDYPGGTVSGVMVTNNPANPAVFFRLSE